MMGNLLVGSVRGGAMSGGGGVGGGVKGFLSGVANAGTLVGLQALSNKIGLDPVASSFLVGGFSRWL